MQHAAPSELLLRFVKSVEQRTTDKPREMTVKDLHVEVRAERLTEYSEWSFQALDSIEEEAVRYEGNTQLKDVIARTVKLAPVTSSQAIAWTSSPSPVAWM